MVWSGGLVQLRYSFLDQLMVLLDVDGNGGRSDSDVFTGFGRKGCLLRSPRSDARRKLTLWTLMNFSRAAVWIIYGQSDV